MVRVICLLTSKQKSADFIFRCMFIPMLVSLFDVVLTIGQLPVESSSLELVISICGSLEFPGDKLLAEISRVLKPGGMVLITGINDGVITLQFVTW